VDSTADGAADATIDSAGDSAIDSAVDSSLDSSIADAPSDSQALDGGTTDCADSSQSDQNSPDIDAAPATLGVVSVQNLHTELTHKDFLLINVHVPNAGEIPQTDTHISYLDTAALKAYVGPDLDKKAVIYCLSNGMSVPAAQFLVDNGYRQIRYLDGGMTAWENAGYPLINP
jgi:rhodanese-related sulfurtransferase